MDSTITAALIAGAISLVGVLVSIYINRGASELQRRLKYIEQEIRDNQDSIGKIDGVLAKSEELRIKLQQILHFGLLINSANENEGAVELTIKTVSEAQLIFNDLVEKWSESRELLNNSEAHTIASQLHEFKSGIYKIFHMTAILKNKEIPEDRMNLLKQDAISPELVGFLEKKLDTFFLAALNEKQQIINRSIGALFPNKAN